MLTARENMRQAIIGGTPDRYVNQYEAIQLLFDPFSLFHNKRPMPGERHVVNAWGISNSFPEGEPGAFPDHAEGLIVCDDIEKWEEHIIMPDINVITDEEWDICKKMYDAVDTEKAYKAVFVAPGLFEQTHHLMSIEEALVNYMDEPELMGEILDYLVEWELLIAKGVCENLHPDALFHHDDWGSERNSFFPPDMFDEFFTKRYAKIYGYYKEHGCEFVFHHSDSYGANLVPYMIEMGIDVWQGCMESNDVPALVDKYQGQITFMGNVDNKAIDFDGWTTEDCERAAEKALQLPMTSYIPCITQGGPGSVFPGAYAELAKHIDRINCERFGFTQEQLDAQRMDWQILF